MRPIRSTGIESTWDQGEMKTWIKKDSSHFLLDGNMNLVWPLIDGLRVTETIIAELDGVVAEGDIRKILNLFSAKKFIRLEEVSIRDQVLSLTEFSSPEISGPSLMSGSAGLALYYLAEGILRDSEKLLRKGRKFLTHALENIHLVMGASSFYEGPLGILWVNELWKLKTGEILLTKKTLKPFLKRYLEIHQNLPAGRFEFLYGVSGWSLAADFMEQKELSKVAATLIHQIELSLEPNIFGVGLRGVDDFRNFHDPRTKPSLKTSPGLAHGLCGPLTALLVLKSQGVLPSTHSDLIKILSETLMNLYQELGSHPLPRNFEDPSSYDRQDWCHGDGGIALTFLAVNKVTGDMEFKRAGQAILKRALNVPDTECDDVGLCHGLGGKLALAMIGKSAEGQVLRNLANYEGKLYSKVLPLSLPLIVSARGAAVSLCALEDPSYVGFLYPHFRG